VGRLPCACLASAGLRNPYATLPQTLSGAPDVRLLLERRFDMFNWFRRHGYPDSIWDKGVPAAAAAAAAVGAKGCLQASQSPAGTAAAAVEAEAIKQTSNAPSVVQIKARAGPSRGTLLLFDFDRTLTDYDAGKESDEDYSIVQQLPCLCHMQTANDNHAWHVGSVLHGMQHDSKSAV
jgi:hypothetical protein